MIRSYNGKAMVKAPSKLEHNQNPKDLMNKLFTNNKIREYKDTVHAKMIANALIEEDKGLRRLQKKSASFRRFADKIKGVNS